MTILKKNATKNKENIRSTLGKMLRLKTDCKVDTDTGALNIEKRREFTSKFLDLEKIIFEYIYESSQYLDFMKCHENKLNDPNLTNELFQITLENSYTFINTNIEYVLNHI